MQTCRSPGCGRPIVWASSVNGDPIPLDPEPTPDGNLDLVDGRAVAYGLEAAAAQRPRYVSHFVTCVDAASFRAPRGGAKRRR